MYGSSNWPSSLVINFNSVVSGGREKKSSVFCPMGGIWWADVVGEEDMDGRGNPG